MWLAAAPRNATRSSALDAWPVGSRDFNDLLTVMRGYGSQMPGTHPFRPHAEAITEAVAQAGGTIEEHTAIGHGTALHVHLPISTTRAYV